MGKIIVAIGAAAVYAAVALFKDIIYGIAYIFKLLINAKENKRQHLEAARASEASKRRLEAENAHRIEKASSLENQINAEFEVSDAYRKKATKERDPVKRAELRRKAAQAEARADALQDKIFELQND